jgi:hypothetical protein
VDEVFVERTTTKAKVRDPEWNETFSTDLLRSAEEIGFTVFHRLVEIIIIIIIIIHIIAIIIIMLPPQCHRSPR